MKKFFILVFVVALSINSSSDAASESLEQAKIFYNQARFQDAIAAYKKAIEDNGRDTELYLNLAYLYKDLLEYGKAIQVLENIPEALKGLRQAKLLGRLYYLCAKHKQAILLLEQWLSRNPDDIELLFYLASTYEDIADLARAEEYYLKITKLQAKHVLAHLKLAGIYYQMKAYQRSAEFYQKVIELDPSITDSRIKLADCFRESGKFEEAYKQYAKCIAINPDDKSLEGKLKAVKAELGEDFLKERKESISRLRRKKLPRITSSLYAAGALPLRVGIGKIEKLVEFKCAGDFSLINKENNALLFKGKAELIYSLIFHKNKVSIQLRDSQGKTLLENLIKPFYIKNASENQLIAIFDIPAGSGNFWAGRSDNQYRGMIEIMPEDDGFWLINLINLEEYLYSVLPSEMPAAWPQEALNTQAIAARTWAVKNLSRHKGEGFNFCSTVHCQVYKGASAEAQPSRRAVEDTAGLILVLDNHPVDILYSNNCGGYTQDGVSDTISLNVIFPFSPLELEDWLQTSPEAFCNLKEERRANFRWSRLYKREELEQMLKQTGINIGTLTGIIPGARPGSAHLNSVKLKAQDKFWIIEKEGKIRKIFANLRSSAFKIDVKYNRQNLAEEFIFYGAGFGHGRGLCQSGIKGMALKGYDYSRILKHYYPNTEVKKLY